MAGTKGLRADAVAAGPARRDSSALQPPFLLVTLLVVCTVFGGASAGRPVVHAVIHAASLLFLVPIVWSNGFRRLTMWSKTALALLAAVPVLGLVQIIPLPSWVADALPGHRNVYAELETVGLSPVRFSSLAPAATAGAIAAAFPVIAIFLLTLQVSARELRRIAVSFVVGSAGLSAALGVVQVLLGDLNPLILYPDLNWRGGAGLFANVNHQATLLLMALPFSALLLAQSSGKKMKRNRGDLAVFTAIAIGVLLVVGIFVTGSMAGYILIGPTLALSLFLVAPRVQKRVRVPRRFERLIVPGLSFCVLAGAAVIGIVVGTSGPLNSAGVGQLTLDGPYGRLELTKQTTLLGLDYAPLGSGLGSFDAIYAYNENADAVSNIFVNHAHNDYAELFLELGLPGLLLIATATILFTRLTLLVWRGDKRDERLLEHPEQEDTIRQLRRASSIALSVLLVHSLVDYPARTLTILSISALVLACLVHPGAKRRSGARSGGLNSIEL